MKRYEEINHTADIGIKAYGRDLAELFSNAALGMFQTVADLSFFHPNQKSEISIKALDKEELLVSWLRELLYKYIFDECIVVGTTIKEISDTELKAVVDFDKITDRSKLKKDIKAVTYHDVHIYKVDDHYETQIIFDV